MASDASPNLGDLVILESGSVYDGESGVIADVESEVAGGVVGYRYAVRLPGGGLVWLDREQFSVTGESVLDFRINEVVRIVGSVRFPELNGGDGVILGAGEEAPGRFRYAVFVSSRQEVYMMSAAELETLGRFEEPYG